MQTVFPSFYLDFHCIGGLCKHSCCVDWEIGIDEQTLENYRTKTDPLTEQIRASLCDTEDGTHFCLGDDGRCPFLNEKNLCRIIMEAGASFLPEICREHPRFRNYCGDRLVELGLGLSCEAVMAIVLAQTELTFLCTDAEIDSLSDLEKIEKLPLDTDFPMLDGFFGDFMREKYRALALLTNQELTAEERFARLLGAYSVDTSSEAFLAFFSKLQSLEIMDGSWRELLERASGMTAEPLRVDETTLKLLALFIFRHARAEGFYSLGTVVALSCNFVYLAQYLYHAAKDKTSFAEIVRLLSSELEYSEENTEALLDFCEQNAS